LIKNNLLDNKNEDVKIVNIWLLNILSKNYITIMNALAYRNISFAMRIIRKSFSLIVKGIFLNLSDEDGNYITIDSFKRFCEENNECCELDNFTNGSLAWAEPAAKALNEVSQVIKNIEGETLTMEMLARLLNLHDLKPSLENAKQYLNHSITELFANAKNPTIEYYFLPDEEKFNYLGSIEKEYMDNSVVSEVYVLQSLSCLIESSMEVLNVLKLDQKYVEPFVYYLDSILSYGDDEIDEDEDLEDLEVDEQIEENLYDEGFISSDELEYPFDVRYNDVMFYNVLNNKNTMSNENINTYFNNYSAKYLVASDVVLCNEAFHKNSTKLAYKYLNVFRSLLIGMRFYDAEFNPKEVHLKNSSFSEMIDENYGDKIIFDSTEFERAVLDDDEIKSNILLITLIQNMVNICNSIILDDVSSSFVEIKSLYDMAVMKTYINVMGDDCLNDFLDECFFLSQKNIQNIKIMEEVLDELEEYQPLSQIEEKKMIQIIKEDEDFEIYEYPSPFDFAPNNINSIADMVAILKDRVDVNLGALNIGDVALLYKILNNPFADINNRFDSQLSLMLLQGSQLIVETLKVEPLYEQNKNMKDVINICEALINFDSKETFAR